MTVEYCDPQHGTELRLQRWWSKISYALYDACVDLKWVLQATGKMLFLVLPSSVSWMLMNDEGEVPDFRMPVKKYWAAKIICFDEEISLIRFPKEPLWDVYSQKVSFANNWIEGSENWYYKDEDTGDIKQGIDFDPVRKYNPLSDGLADVAFFALIIAVVKILWEMGLGKVATKMVMNLIANWKMKDKIELLHTINKEISDLQVGIDEIKGRIGVRLAIR